MIILASLFLHLLFFVVSQDYKLSEHYKKSAEQEMAWLTEEISAPLSTMDRVSMSVIADRYIKHDTLDFVGIYDDKETLIVPVGQETKNGHRQKDTITSGNKVLGYIVIQTPSVSRAKIISDNWAFFLGVLALHIIIWLIYGYFARPSQELTDEIANDVRARLLTNGILSPHLQIDTKHDTPKADKPLKVSDLIKPSLQLDRLDKSDKKSEPVPADEQNIMVISLNFEDPNGLLGTLGVHAKSAYFALCNQLLNKATQEVLALPLLAGVVVDKISDYDDKGVTLTLKATKPEAELATASVMLAKLMLMLNQIVYDKHRELKRFCLPIRVLVSDPHQEEAILAVAKKHRENPLILISDSSLTQLTKHIEVGKLLDPLTVGERESRHIKKVSETIGTHLQTVRDAVLLSE